MKIDGGIGLTPDRPGGLLSTAARTARRLEDSGYDGGWSAEVRSDPFLPLAIAAEHTSRIDLGTAIAVAFARNPMTMATTAWDLQAYSGGRLVVGLGSQIKPHITKRFSMPWSSPAPRMREFVLAMRAIWDCWSTGERLAFRGDFYKHVLMTPMFDPGPNPHGHPRVFVAGVGPVMTRVAGEVADGFLSHAFQTADYLREVTVPALEDGLARSGRDRGDFEIAMPLFTVTGRNDAEMARSAAFCKTQIAFYGSTPAYRPVLDHHGWGDAHDELHRLSKEGKWAEMGDVIDDTMLSAFAVVGGLDELGPAIVERFDGVVDRIQFYAHDEAEPQRWAPVIDAIRRA